MIKVQGMVVSQSTAMISPKVGGKQFTPFELKTMYISDGKTRPLEVQSTNTNTTKVGEKVDLEVYIQLWKGENKGYTLREVVKR